MARSFSRFWLPRSLFWLTLLVAAGLFLLVFLAPLVDNGQARPQGWFRWVAAFARDVVLRRTALASSLGLTVTAYVFFRPPGRLRPGFARTGRPSKSPPPGNIAGA
jgi:hypothetical protein